MPIESGRAIPTDPDAEAAIGSREDALLQRPPMRVIYHAQRALDVRWDRDVAQVAARLYAKGCADQMRLPPGDRAGRGAAYGEALARMLAEVDAQISSQGYYVPFGPVRMVVARKVEGAA